METDGGGWTVFQRRQDGSEDFYRVWDDYVSGFGNLTGEFWLGLDKIHRLTSGNATALRIDIGDFEGNTAFAQYSTFRVQDSTTEYELNVGGFSGTATDSLRYHNNQAFSTRDRDNDPDHRHCAATFRGGWWYYDCIWSCLNGPYHDGDPTPYLQPDGIVWFTWKNNYYSLRFSEMKLRRI